MSLEEKKELMQSMAEMIKGAQAGQIIMFAESGSMIVYKQFKHESENGINADIIAKALKKCAPFIWGNSAYAVAFCVCRDMYGWQGNASMFERELIQQGIEFPVGTINAALSRTPYLRMNINKWADNGAMERVLKFKDEFLFQIENTNDYKSNCL